MNGNEPPGGDGGTDALLIAAIEAHKDGRFDEARRSYEAVLAAEPGNARAREFLGHVLIAKGAHDDGIDVLARIAEASPGSADARHALGDALREAERFDEAEQVLGEALAIDPDHVMALNSLGLVHQKQKRLDRALEYYLRAYRLKPDQPELLNNMSFVFQAQGRLDQAMKAALEAIRLRPEFAEAFNNLGNTLNGKGRTDEAIDALRAATLADPSYAPAHSNLGVSLAAKNKIEEAIASLQTALDVDPDHVVALPALLGQYRVACAWREAAALAPRVEASVRTAAARGDPTGETPHVNVGRCDDPADNLLCARLSSQQSVDRMASLHIKVDYGDRGTKDRITVGYLSTDYRNHPVSHLLAGMFGHHDRTRFEVVAYSVGKDDRSIYRRRVQAGVDRFVDLAGQESVRIAQQIAGDGVDILVDLNGHTEGGRTDVLAIKPAPVQAVYLGFPGTTGADFVDYIVADAVIAPEEHAAFYSEALVHMPDCYMVGEYETPAEGWTRAAQGLPGEALVFCCFNHAYKLDPELWDVAMNLLKRFDGSVLWLAKANPIASANLKREAGWRGVDPGRILFADRVPSKADHLARLGLADVALDTRVYNGHTTTVDALWAGVPVVTTMGGHYASRAAASMLGTVGLEDLVAADVGEYEAIAARLASDAAERADLRARLLAARETAALFDMPRFVRNLEKAYGEMWRRWLAGEAPGVIRVSEL